MVWIMHPDTQQYLTQSLDFSASAEPSDRLSLCVRIDPPFQVTTNGGQPIVSETSKPIRLEEVGTRRFLATQSDLNNTLVLGQDHTVTLRPTASATRRSTPLREDVDVVIVINNGQVTLTSPTVGQNATTMRLILSGEAKQLPPLNRFAFNADLSPGINIASSLESCSEALWGVYIEKQDVINVAERGFKSVRLPVRWHHQLLPSGNINPVYMERVVQIVDWCVEKNLYVMLNVHHYDTYLDQPTNKLPELLSIWTQISDRFRNHSQRVFFELLNEPRANNSDGNPCGASPGGEYPAASYQSKVTNDVLHLHTPQVMAVIRVSNRTRICVIGGSAYNGLEGLATFKPPPSIIGDPYLLLTIHYYEPFEFTHIGEHDDWTENTWKPGDSVTWPDWSQSGNQKTTTKLQRIVSEMAYGAFHGNRLGMPVLLGEFGTRPGFPDYSIRSLKPAPFIADPLDRAEWVRQIRIACQNNNISWFYFDLRSIFGATPQHGDGSLTGATPIEMAFGIFSTTPSGLGKDGRFSDNLTAPLFP
jgi:endoglucanase